MRGNEALHSKVRSDTVSREWCVRDAVQGVCDVAWTLRGHLLASASDDKTLRLWDGDTGACVRLLEGHTNFVFCCNFNPTGNYLVRLRRAGRLPACLT